MAATDAPVSRPVKVTFHVEGSDDAIIVTARGAARELARELGFGVVDQTRIATAVSEIVRNVVLYARSGEVTFSRATRADGTSGLRISVVDAGPGIPDLGGVLEGGHSTGRGFGCGVRGSKQMMDEFEIESRVGVGTSVRMCKWLS